MAGVFGVSQVNGYIKRLFEDDFALARIAVKGEVSNCKHHSSGHIYFTLKDEKSHLSCVMFASYARNLRFAMREGMQLVVRGSIRVFERDGKYQLYAETAEDDGQGVLYRRFEETKQRLEEEGLFDPAYKKPLPPYARRVGVVTAQTGAAIQDIINISHRRNPCVQLILCPAKVQGEGAAATIVSAIKKLDAMGLDCLIVGRGGGSIEDLWAFNEEEVAYAIFGCRTPVISAVGHETDFTIADFVADMRAPTPSAAAELAVFDLEAFDDELEGYRQSMRQSVRFAVRRERDRLERLQLKLQLTHPSRKLAEQKAALDQYGLRLSKGMQASLTRTRMQVALFSERLEAQSPLARLRGGYAFMTDTEDMPLDTKTLQPGSEVLAHMEREILSLTVKEVRKREV